MSVEIGTTLRMNNRPFLTGVAQSTVAMKAMRAEFQRQNREMKAHQRTVDSTRREYEKLSNTIRGSGHSAHLLSLNFYELRTAMRNTVTRGAITGFASLAGAISSIGVAAIGAVGSLSNLSGALALAGGVGLAAAFQGIAVTALGLNKVMKALTTTGHQHKLALDKLTPAARHFVGALAPLRDAFREIKLLSQAGLFPGLERALHNITPLFKILKQAAYDTAINMGYLAERGAGMLAKRAGLLKTILNNNQVLIQRYGRSIENLGAGVLDIWVAAIPEIDHVAKKIEGFSKGFKTAMSGWRKDGSLGAFFAEFRTSFDNWTSILGGFGKTFFNIWKASEPAVHRMERDISDMFGKFANWTGKHGGEMQGYFIRLLAPTRAFASLVGAAAASIVRIGSQGADNAVSFFDAIRTKVLPIVEQLALTLNANVTEGLGHALSGLLTFVQTGMPALESMLKPLGLIAHGFGAILETASDFVNFGQKTLGSFGGLLTTYLSVTAIAATWSALRMQVTGVMSLLAMPVGVANKGAKSAQGGLVTFAKNPRRAMSNATPVIFSSQERQRQANMRRVAGSGDFTGTMLGRPSRNVGPNYPIPVNYRRDGNGVYGSSLGAMAPYGATSPIPRYMAEVREPAPGFGDPRLRQVPVSQVSPWYLTPRGGKNTTRQRQFQWMSGEQQSLMNTKPLAPWERNTQARQFVDWQRSMSVGAGVIPFKVPRQSKSSLAGGEGAAMFKSYRQQMEKSTSSGFLGGLKKTFSGGKGSAALGTIGALAGSVAFAVAIPVGIAVIGGLVQASKDKRPQIVQDVESAGAGLGIVSRVARPGLNPMVSGGRNLKTQNPTFTRLAGELNAAIKDGDLAKIRKVRTEFANLDDTFTQLGRNSGLSKIRGDIGTLVSQASTALLGKLNPDFQSFSSSAHDSIGHVRDALNVLRTQIVVKMPVAGQEYKQAMAAAFGQAATAIQQGIDQGLINEKKGLKEIKRLLIKEYKSLGFTASQADHLAAGGGDTRGATGGNEHTPPVTGPTPAQPQRQHGTTGAARGMYMGGKGRVGHDSMPLDVDGRKVITAPGEYVGVFTRHQQAAMEQATGQPIDKFFASHKTPHYASQGGIWKLGERIQGMSYAGTPYSVGENSHFGGVHPVHVKGSLHYKDEALDINHDNPAGSERGALDKLAKMLIGQGWHVLWQVPGHFDHLHVDDASGGSLGGIGGTSAAVAKMLKPPKIGMPGLLGGLLQGAMNRATSGANKQLASISGVGGGDSSSEGSVTVRGKDLKDINHVFPRHSVHDEKGRAKLAPALIKKLASSVGLPTWFERIVKGESGYFPGVVQDDPGDGNVGWGLLQMTPHAWGAQSAAQQRLRSLGGIGQMLNPVKNFEMAKYLYDHAASKQPHTRGFPWFGTRFLDEGGLLSMISGGLATPPPKPYGNTPPVVNPNDAVTNQGNPKKKKPKKKKAVHIAPGRPGAGGGIGTGAFRPKSKKPKPHARGSVKHLISKAFGQRDITTVDPITGEDLGTTRYQPTQFILGLDKAISSQQDALNRLIGTQDLTNEQAIVTVGGQDFINSDGTTVDGKFIPGISQAVAELNAQVMMHQSIGNKYSKEQNLAKGIPSQQAIQERIGRLAQIKKVFDANVALRKSYAKKLSGMKSSNYTWQEAVAHNSDLITKWQRWKRDSINEPQADTNQANHEMDHLRDLNSNLRRRKPKGTVYGSTEYNRTLSVYQGRGIENRLLVGDKDATAWQPTAGYAGKVANSLGAWRSIDTVRSEALTNSASGLLDEKGSIASIRASIAEWTGTTVPPASITTDTTAADLKKSIDTDKLRDALLGSTQFGVLLNFAKLLGMRSLGAYSHGGLVPETGMALLHKGEYVHPAPDGPFRNGMNATAGSHHHFAVEVHMHGKSGELAEFVDARVRRVAPGAVSRSQGRSVRRISAAPGARIG